MLVNDFVFVSGNGLNNFYKINEIISDIEIHIIDINDPELISGLKLDKGKWKVMGTDFQFYIDFSTPEEYKKILDMRICISSIISNINKFKEYLLTIDPTIYINKNTIKTDLIKSTILEKLKNLFNNYFTCLYFKEKEYKFFDIDMNSRKITEENDIAIPYIFGGNEFSFTIQYMFFIPVTKKRKLSFLFKIHPIGFTPKIEDLSYEYFNLEEMKTLNFKPINEEWKQKFFYGAGIV